jgi:hypothetical protein
MPAKAKTVQALTLRIPVADYNLLRAEAFVRDWSINEVVLDAIKGVVDDPVRREVLERVLAHARSAGDVRGRGTQRPFTFQGKRAGRRSSS